MTMPVAPTGKRRKTVGTTGIRVLRAYRSTFTTPNRDSSARSRHPFPYGP